MKLKYFTLAFFIKFDNQFKYTMKFKAYYIFLAMALFISAASFAQVDRSIGRNQYKNGPAPKGKNGKVDFVDQTVIYYTKELKLDDFQQAAVRNIIEEQRDPINELMAAKEITSDEKRDKAKALNDKIDDKIMKILSEEQKTKYKVLQDKRNKF